MSLYLCVDCGGSKTSAVVCDASGTVLGRAHGGPSNYANLGLTAFAAAVNHTIAAALASCTAPAPLPASAFSAAWFGLSGVDTPAAIAAVVPSLSALTHIPPGPRLLVTNDTDLLAAPLSLRTDVAHCIACVAGTGATCISFHRSDDSALPQMMARVGGWGWILGDEGSGFHVGREALRQLLTEADMASLGATSPSDLASNPTLKARVLHHFGVTDVHEILSALYRPDPLTSSSFDADTPVYQRMTREKRLSSLCPIVFSSAFDDGDPLALNILCTCADDLASQIAILLIPPDNTRVESLRHAVEAKESVISFGGSLVAVNAYRKMVLDSLAERGHVFKDVQIITDASAVGAAALAYTFSKQGPTG